MNRILMILLGSVGNDKSVALGAGLMGNINGYEINSSRVDSPVLYVGSVEALAITAPVVRE